MSTCSKCGTELKEKAKYCNSCGGQTSLDEKKARVMGPDRTWLKPALIAGAVIAVLAGGWMFRDSRAGNQMGGAPVFSPHREASSGTSKAVAVMAEKGDIRIPLKSVEDGNAHFFSYATGGKTVTFFVMKAKDGSLRTAFDACVACNHAKLGYRQEGGVVVCNNCGMGFAPDVIGKVTGGCNPIPLEKSEDGQMIVVKAKDLEAGVQYF